MFCEKQIPALLKGVRGYLYGVALFSTGLNVLALTGSLFMLQIYDRVLPSGSVPTLVVFSALTAALFAFYGFLDFFRGRVLVRLGAWLDAAISSKVYRICAVTAQQGPQQRRQILFVISTLSDPSCLVRRLVCFSTCRGCPSTLALSTCSTRCSQDLH